MAIRTLNCFFYSLLISPLEQFVALPVIIRCPVFHTHAIVIVCLFLFVFLLITYDKNETVFFSRLNSEINASYEEDLINRIFFDSRESYFWQTELSKDIAIWKKSTQSLAFAGIKTSTKIEVFFDAIYKFIKEIIKDNLQVDTYIYIPQLYIIFLFIIVSNSLGLIPFSITATGSFILIIYFTLSIFIGINVIGVLIKKIKYFGLFLPSGVPLIIAPVLIMIEFFSYIARVLSLSIRLFANMVAGHSLLKIIVTSIWHILIASSGIFWPITVVSWFLLLPVFLLECIIALLQAYVFTLLLVLYINDVINLH